MKGKELLYQKRKYKLYNEFDKFTSFKGESIYEYYWRFAQLINDLHTIGMTMQQIQVNKKFLNALQQEWSKFVTPVKLANNLYTTNYDQLYAYLSQHEGHANKACQERVVKCYNYQVEGHMARQCTQPKRPKNYVWFKEKMLLVQAHESGQTTIPQIVTFQTDDLDAYNSDCDDISSAKAVLMANLSSYDLDVLSEYLQETQDAIVQDTNPSAQQDAMIIPLNNKDAPEILEFFKINEWQAKINAKDVSIANLRKHIENLKGKILVEKDVQSKNANVIAPGMFRLDLEPLSPKLLKNKDAHIDYIKHTLQELVKHARALRLLDSDLDFACNASNVPSSSLVDFRLFKFFSGIWTSDAPSVTGNRSQLINFFHKFLGTVRFGNDQIAKIMGYGNYQMGNVTIS
uniref:Integrase, catalytic region, zinc finger, CCHC-type, peptidase aspartic, catalytic n=1 Tax=Tanacetum cinerariifolium TaxID=118510 RepID=A0A6L2LVK6_TANCI|nr:integrase, catalytic region, zinc finger, CCHC-type, peptidase aspartic, catalytic [Tanacetum cinerariifolium]